MTIFQGVGLLKYNLFQRAGNALRIVLVLLPVTGGAHLLLAQSEQNQIPKFSVNAHLVRLFVSVRDRASNAIVANLNKEDFAVSDENTSQQIAIFERNTSMPLSVAILVDTSGSTRKDLPVETNAILKFLKTLKQAGHSNDALAVYSFNWQVRMDVGFTRSEQRAERALRSLQNQGGTSLYDAVYLVAEDIADREGRHVMIVVTDGGDTTSYKKFDDAVQAALRSDSIIYPIVIVPITSEAGRNTGGEHALDTMARATGGRPFYPAGITALNEVFADILKELRTQYLLGYYPKGVATGSRRYHPVTVKTSRSDLKVTARSGYYDP